MVEINEVEKIINDLSNFYEAANKVNNIKAVLVNPLFGEDDHKKLIEILANTLKLSKISVKFLTKVIELRAYTELPSAINILTKLYFDAKKMSRAVITTGVELTEQLKESLKNSLSDKFKKKFELDCKIDGEIVGGIMIKIDSNLYDLSTRGQLRLLKEKLLSGDFTLKNKQVTAMTSESALKVSTLKTEASAAKVPDKGEPPKPLNISEVTNYLSDKLSSEESSEDWRIDFKKI